MQTREPYVARAARGSSFHAVVTALAAAHVLLVYLYAFKVAPKSELLERATSYYGAVSGANNTYSFFAPGVPLQTRTRFEVVLPDGSHRFDRLASGASDEADRRINNTLATSMGAAADDRELQQELMGSWAAKIFARYPGAESVIVHMDIYDLPKMAEYRDGRRPDWRPLFSERYERGYNP